MIAMKERIYTHLDTAMYGVVSWCLHGVERVESSASTTKKKHTMDASNQTSATTARRDYYYERLAHTRRAESRNRVGQAAHA